MSIEIKERDEVYHAGPDEGKPSGDKMFTIIIDGKTKGQIFYSKYIDEYDSEPRIGAYSVYSEFIFGNTYKSKRFKTFTGAKKFLINTKPKYMSLCDAINKSMGCEYIKRG
jgi:hypothetical protein